MSNQEKTDKIMFGCLLKESITPLDLSMVFEEVKNKTTILSTLLRELIIHNKDEGDVELWEATSIPLLIEGYYSLSKIKQSIGTMLMDSKLFNMKKVNFTTLEKTCFLSYVGLANLVKEDLKKLGIFLEQTERN